MAKIAKIRFVCGWVGGLFMFVNMVVPPALSTEILVNTYGGATCFID